MGIFFVYILKSSVCLSLFYLFYRWLLSKETFHRFNRIMLLSILLISLLLPLIEVTTAQQTGVNRTILTIEQLLMMAEASTSMTVGKVAANQVNFSWVEIALLIYLTGIVFFVCRNLYSLFRLLRLLKSGKCKKLGKKVILIIHECDNVAPFSWMRYVVISDKDFRESGREILIHECAHIANRHSLDLLIVDICTAFQWFNPGVWLLKQELQNVHEYEADEAVLKEGVDAKQYQLLLIKKAVGTRLYSMANSFNHSKLKKRITMMLKEKSKSRACLRYFYVLPLAVVAITAFARPEVSKSMEKIAAVKVSDLTAIVETKVMKNVVAAKNDLLISDSGSLFAEDVLQTTEKIDTVKIGWSDGQSTVTSLNLPDKKSENPLVIVDGKEIPYATLKALDTNRIKSINVLKGKETEAAYGRKGKDGVVVITLLTDEEFNDKQKIVGYVKPSEDSPKTWTNACIGTLSPAHTKPSGDSPKTWTNACIGTLSPAHAKPSEDSPENFALIVSFSPAHIESSKDSSPFLMIGSNVLLKSQSGKFSVEGWANPPLVIVDGKEADYSIMSTISTDKIKKISVLKDDAATKAYGDKGKNGVIVLELKPDMGDK